MVGRVEGVREASVGTFIYETAIIKIRIWVGQGWHPTFGAKANGLQRGQMPLPITVEG